MTLLILVFLMVCFAFALRSVARGFLSHSPLVQHAEARTEAGYISAQDMSYFIDRMGVAQTVLRPSGVADFDGVKLDVVADGEYIPAGAGVRVVKVEGARIVVRPERESA